MASGDTTAPLSDAPAPQPEAASPSAPKLADATPRADAHGDAQQGDTERKARLAHKAALRKSQRALKRAKVAGSPPTPAPGDAPGDTAAPAKPRGKGKRPDATPEQVAAMRPQVAQLWNVVNAVALQKDPHLALSDTDVEALAEGTAPAAAKWLTGAVASPEAAALAAVVLVFLPKVLAWNDARKAAQLEAQKRSQLQAVAA